MSKSEILGARIKVNITSKEEEERKNGKTNRRRRAQTIPDTSNPNEACNRKMVQTLADRGMRNRKDVKV
jgi:hypothetical protein